MEFPVFLFFVRIEVLRAFSSLTLEMFILFGPEGRPPHPSSQAPGSSAECSGPPEGGHRSPPAEDEPESLPFKVPFFGFASLGSSR